MSRPMYSEVCLATRILVDAASDERARRMCTRTMLRDHYFELENTKLEIKLVLVPWEI